MAFSARTPEKTKILTYVTGLWPQRGASHNGSSFYTMLSQDDSIRRATSSYIDDVYIDENMVSTEQARKYLAGFGGQSPELCRCEGVQNDLVDARKQGPRNSVHYHSSKYFHTMREACESLPSVCLAESFDRIGQRGLFAS